MTKKKTSTNTKATLMITDEVLVQALLKTVDYISMIDRELNIEGVSDGKIMLDINLLRFFDKEYDVYDYSALLQTAHADDRVIWGGVRFVDAIRAKLHNFTLIKYDVYIGGDEFIDFRLEIHLAHVQPAKIIFT
jgi:hypothetical protein